MFKLPKSEDQQVMIKEYEKLWAAVPKKVSSYGIPESPSPIHLLVCYSCTLHQANSPQDGKPYILSMAAGPAEANERAQGYTFVAKSEFASVEDMMFYDTECEAHMELKKTVKSLSLDGVPLMVYFKPKVVVGA
jgi:hypothetical protein